MNFLFILLLISFSSIALSEKVNNSDNKFINLTSDIKNNLKSTNNVENESMIDKPNDKEIKKIESVKIGKLGMPSLGSIGVETSLNQKIGLNLWNNFTASSAIKHINLLPNKSSSRSYQRLLNEVYASISEPPKGNPNEISKFLKARLLKLALNGQIDYFYQIINLSI